MKHKKLVAVGLALVALAAVGFIAWPANVRSPGSTAPQIISGHVTSISNECQSDGACTVTLDGTKTIITGCGLMAGGKTCRSYDQTKLHTGQQVEATVRKNDSGSYNLECESCTISVIEARK